MTRTIDAERYRGRRLIDTPLLNKSDAFTVAERTAFHLHGLLPPSVETLENQVARAKDAYAQKTTDLERHIYLRALQDTNETLFYALMAENITELMPMVYTPVVGLGCQRFSEIYRKPRGLFISYPLRDQMDDLLDSAGAQDVRVIVVTDGERILGLGDQGTGGMGIPIGKLSLYTACGGVAPDYTLPITLDVGTNNQDLIDDPFYIGWRHERITGDDYVAFVDAFVDAVKRKWPNVLLQFEDFAQNHATMFLERYRDQLCMFNDDVQGTASVVVGTVLSAVKESGRPLSEQRVVVVGAGSAGCGIAEQMIRLMVEDGLDPEEARKRFYMIDREGLVFDTQKDLWPFQAALAHTADHVAAWTAGETPGKFSLLETVQNAEPTIIIGVTGDGPSRRVHRRGDPRHGGEGGTAHRVPAVQSDLALRGAAGRRARLDRRPRHHRYRQPVPAGDARRQDLPHRPDQQLVHLPGSGPGHSGARHSPGERRHVHGRLAGPGRLQHRRRRRRAGASAAARRHPAGLARHRHCRGQGGGRRGTNRGDGRCGDRREGRRRRLGTRLQRLRGRLSATGRGVRVMAKMRVADQMAQALEAAGVERVWGVVGDSLNGFTDALRTSKTITWMHTRHEETAAFAAGAEAQLTGKLAVCAGSCGPGNLHLINGLFDCHRTRTPVLAIAAHIPSAEIGSGYFQETHPENLFRECSHYCELVSSPAQMPRAMEIAMRTAIQKQGVAVLVIPGDVALAAAESDAPVTFAETELPVVVPPEADRKSVV